MDQEPGGAVMAQRQVTPEEFAAFKEEVEAWVVRFGLQDWEFFIAHEEVDSDTYACVRLNRDGRQARISLGLTVLDSPVTSDPRKSAFHEVCHVLLADMYFAGKARFTTQEELDRAEHSVIRVLEKVLFRHSAQSRAP